MIKSSRLSRYRIFAREELPDKKTIWMVRLEIILGKIRKELEMLEERTNKILRYELRIEVLIPTR